MKITPLHIIISSITFEMGYMNEHRKKQCNKSRYGNSSKSNNQGTKTPALPTIHLPTNYLPDLTHSKQSRAKQNSTTQIKQNMGKKQDRRKKKYTRSEPNSDQSSAQRLPRK